MQPFNSLIRPLKSVANLLLINNWLLANFIIFKKKITKDYI
tara:strand:- start:9413 stop:9535 length:123 start_codon:yes stop_codon:yes gene_type:complete